MKKAIEVIRRHPYAYGTTAAVVLALAGIETVGYARNNTEAMPTAGVCTSPYVISDTYVNPNASSFWRAHQTGFGPTGVVASGVLPEGAYGIQASFKHPDADERVWDEHGSDLVLADETGKVAFKAAIGDGEVQFGVRVVAPEGSTACNAIPAIAFTYMDRSAYFHSGETIPWNNPIAIGVNVFG